MSLGRILAWLLVGAGVLLSSMVWHDLAVRAPHDLKLVRARLIQLDLPPQGQTHRYMSLLEVDLVSESDIQSLSNRYGLFINEVTKPCDPRKSSPNMRVIDYMYPGIYDGVGQVDIWSMAPDGAAYRKQPSGPRNANGQIIYRVFLNVEEPGEPNTGIQPYNLKQSPVDLCIYIEGKGNFWLGGELPTLTYFRSNSVRIPNSVSKKALELPSGDIPTLTYPVRPPKGLTEKALEQIPK
jgi:hypothetical protein